MFTFNENNEVVTQEMPTAILVGVQLDESIDKSMEELKALSESAGMEVLALAVQSLEKPNKATYIGKGKVEEIAEMAHNMDCKTVVFNDELSGIQIRNLEEALGVKVIDRTILILDIFAGRATSKEGKLQVEMAQLKYRLPRLTGFGKELSRLGAGVGTRGPGEKKLEIDRRHIEKRIYDIRKELKRAEKVRSTQNVKRTKSDMPVVSLVGYTNAGKSTIMNYIQNKYGVGDENKQVFAKDMLFATLDTSHRKIKLGNGKEFMLIDTVGFVSKLPHSLISAFKSTLNEVLSADLILHIIDGSDEDADYYMSVTEGVLEEILKDKGRAVVSDKSPSGNIIVVHNKMDKCEELTGIGSRAYNESDVRHLYVSAKTGYGMEQLEASIDEVLFGDCIRAKFLIPYDKGNMSSYICENSNVISKEYVENGTLYEAEVKIKDYGRLREYEI